MFSIKNAVYVALMQIGVIVAGVLAAGLISRMWRESSLPLPSAAALLLNHTLMFMVIPLGWFVVALLLRTQSTISEDTKQAAFWLGVFLLIALGIFVGYADIAPWFSFHWKVRPEEP